MNYLEAQKILDAVRDGVAYPLATINKALEMTGDLDERQIQRIHAGMRGERMDYPLQKTGTGVWCQRSARLVDIDDPRH